VDGDFFDLARVFGDLGPQRGVRFREIYGCSLNRLVWETAYDQSSEPKSIERPLSLKKVQSMQMRFVTTDSDSI